jgi:hypothetical protein
MQKRRWIDYQEVSKKGKNVIHTAHASIRRDFLDRGEAARVLRATEGRRVMQHFPWNKSRGKWPNKATAWSHVHVRVTALSRVRTAKLDYPFYFCHTVASFIIDLQL